MKKENKEFINCNKCGKNIKTLYIHENGMCDSCFKKEVDAVKEEQSIDGVLAKDYVKEKTVDDVIGEVKEQKVKDSSGKNMNKSKLCPFCAESIKFNAVKCRYCGEWLNNTDRSKEISKLEVVKDQDLASSRKSIDDLGGEQFEFVNGFSFGAMLGVPWWSLYVRYYWGLLWTLALFIPFAAPVVAIIFGSIARKYAWESGRWDSFEEFKERVRTAENFCVGFFIFSAVIGLMIYASII